jgi:MFS family permease
MLGRMNTIENQVFRTYWHDGLLDVFGAVAVLAIGVFWIAELHVFGAIVPAMLVPLWGPFRQRFVEPRLGLVEFSEERERRNTNRLWLVVMGGAVAFALVMALYFLRTRLGVNPSVSLIAGLPALLLALLAGITAFLVSTLRFLVYAALLATAGIAGAIFGLEPGNILVIAAVPMLVIALAVLVRFVRNNPIEGASE